MAITSRNTRKVTKQRPWQEKIEPECLEYLEAYRKASARTTVPDGSYGNLLEWLQQWRNIAKLFPSPPVDWEQAAGSVVSLDARFVAMLDQFAPGHVKEGENRLAPRYAKMLEIAQPIALLLEEPQARAGVALGLGFFYVLVEPLIIDLRRQQFGMKPLDSSKVRSLAAIILELLAKLLRGRWQPPKGRINTELIALINLIYAHQTHQLTPQELGQALAHAGLAVAEGETWRIWLHRAKKRGLIDEISVPT